jgi:acyl-CoA reductase-like NAD-dependent aldehyde dehydrogenase
MALKVDAGKLFSINPGTGQIIAAVTAIPPEAIPAVVAKARSAFETWSELSLQTRLELFRKAHREFFLARDEIARVISEETGKHLVEAYTEILVVLDCFKYYLKHIPKFLQDQKVAASNPLLKIRTGYVRYEPLGVVLVISSWNFPFLLAMHHIIPALLAGNVVIHKPSEHAAQVGLKIREVFDRSYLPKGVLEIVTGLADVGSALASAKVDKIFFTGSTEVGRKIHQSAAENLTPVNMELGGSDAMIVLEDANLKRAVNAALWGGFTNAGQACLSVERVYVQELIFDQFLEELIGKARALRLKANDSEEGEISSLISHQQLAKIERLVNDAVQKGAVLRLGGKTIRDQEGWYFEPAILTSVTAAMDIAREEIFGPVMIVTPFITDDEAAFLANDSNFGLSASVWTRDRERGLKIAQKIKAGAVLINDLFVHIGQSEAPYTGYKNSALGVSHGPWGIMEMVRPKYVNYDRPWLNRLLGIFVKRLVDNDLWWFQYNRDLSRGFGALLESLHENTIWKRLRAVPGMIRLLLRKNYL